MKKVEVNAKQIRQVINAEKVNIDQSAKFQKHSLPNEELPSELGHIQRALIKHFNLEEIRTLCFHIGINYDDLDGQSLNSKTRELVLYLKRREQIDALVQEICKERPKVKFNFQHSK